MAAVAALLESRAALAALRRTLPRGGLRVVTCRTPAGLHRALNAHLIEAIVLAPRPTQLAELPVLRQRFPEIPVVAYAHFRPDDGELLLLCQRHRVAAFAVEGVDDAVVGDLVSRHSAAAERRRALADAPRALRLTDSLQRAVWELLLDRVDESVRTETIARRMRMSREHLSRQFAAGGAPNLKRVIDLTRIATAAQLLRNPGYTIGAVVALLGFASPSHLNGTSRRIAGVPTRSLPGLGPRGVLAAFARGKTRSRI